MSIIKMKRDGNTFTLTRQRQEPKNEEASICVIFICVILLTIILTLSIRQGIVNKELVKQPTIEQQTEFKIGR
jgi:hypothetical protein